MRKNSLNRPSIIEADIRNRLDEALCPPRLGDDDLVERVRERVMTAITGKTETVHHTIRAEGGVWETVATGIERKLLWESGDAVSCLMRLAPGAVVAGHPHLLDEECVVLEGSLRIGWDLVLRTGDFHVGINGLDHDVAATETGALVYLRGARSPA